MKKTWFLVMDVKDITTGFGPTKMWGSKALNGAIKNKWVGRGDGSLFVK